MAMSLPRSILPGWLLLDHRIEHGQPFAHAGGQRHVLLCAGRQEALIEPVDHRIRAGGHPGSPVQHRPDTGAPPHMRRLPR